MMVKLTVARTLSARPCEAFDRFSSRSGVRISSFNPSDGRIESDHPRLSGLRVPEDEPDEDSVACRRMATPSPNPPATPVPKRRESGRTSTSGHWPHHPGDKGIFFERLGHPWALKVPVIRVLGRSNTPGWPTRDLGQKFFKNPGLVEADCQLHYDDGSRDPQGAIDPAHPSARRSRRQASSTW